MGCLNFPEMINFVPHFWYVGPQSDHFQKIQTVFLLQDIVGVETFAKNMILLNQISTLFSTIWLQVLPF